MPTDIVKIEGSNNQQYEINSKITTGIVRATMDSSSTSTAFIATAPNITGLYDGLAILLKNTVAASASGCTLNLNQLGAKSIYSTYNDGVTSTGFALNRTYLFIFDYANDRWQYYAGYYDTNTDTDTIGEYYGHCPVGSNGWYRYNLGMQVDNNTWESVTLSASTSKKAINPHGFLTTSTMIYQGSDSFVEGDIINATNTRICSGSLINVRYISGYSATWSAKGRPLFFKGTIGSDGKFYLVDSNWVVDSYPSTNDGYYYWYIGQMYDAYRYYIQPYHPIYYHDGTGIREYLIASKTVNDWTVLANPIIEAYDTNDSITINNFSNYNELMVVVSVQYNPTQYAEYKHFICSSDDDALNPSIDIKTFQNGYYYSSGYYYSYTVGVTKDTTNDTITFDWKSSWSSVKHNNIDKTSDYVYRITIYGK